MVLEFRDNFSYNPDQYLELNEDQPDWDTSLQVETFEQFFQDWQRPEEVDQDYKMEKQLH